MTNNILFFPAMKFINQKNKVVFHIIIICLLQSACGCYAIINNHLQIGTDSLMFIARGFVKVDKCPHLCFVDTVDWTELGAGGLHFANVNNGTCDACPNPCKGHCWNATQCQVPTSSCHRECLGCTVNNSSSHCLVCKNLEDNGTCVEKCPPEKYVHAYANKCVTKEECPTLMKSKGPWWTHNHTCISNCPQYHEPYTSLDANGQNETTCRNCGGDCEKHCSTVEIESIYKLQTLKGCTHIDSNLVIKVKDDDPNFKLPAALEENLGSVKYIEGYLVVARMNALKSLSFLKNLIYIGGENTESISYAIFVYENQNLQQLFGKVNLTVGRGTLRFHNNPQLCPVEIYALANAIGINYSSLDVSPYSNGDKAACVTEIMKVKVNGTSKNATLEWDRPALPANDSYIGYTVYYKEQILGNASISDSDNVCAESEETRWRSSFTRNNSIFLANLEPYTRYAYYIKIYRSSMVTAQSTIMYMLTSPDDPEMPLDVTVTAVDHSTVKLEWKPPRRINGILAHYKVDFNELPDFPVDRNYCTDPTTLDGSKIDEDSEDIEIEHRLSNRTVNTPEGCSCPIPKSPFDKDKFNDITINTLYRRYELCEDQAQSKFQRDDCKPLIYNVIDHNKSDVIMINKRNGNQYRAPVNTSNQYYIFPNRTSFDITGLRHSTMYIFYFSACNEQKNSSSPILQLFARTKKKEDADDIKYVEVKTIDPSTVKIIWTEPDDPNSVIVSYRLHVIKDDLHAAKTTDCLPKNSSFEGPEYFLSELLPGSYSVRVQAESLAAGLGRFSKKREFLIPAPAKDLVIIIPVIVVVSLLILSAIVFFSLYKRKQILENIRLFPSINPDYEGVVYEEDEWEIDRIDVVIGEDLGRGTFGTVNYGIIKSRNLPCAVKTINENLSVLDRMEFLKEASVMKSFSNCHHVVKLLGVVSKGQPPLVVMELMDRGDLKKFLRRTRDSSHNLTSYEIYRMAAEIADGMAYLAAKKFVHRDLAARNCMVASDRTVKIGDFGMTRDIYETDYYRKESKGLLPVRWMAPESLADGVFTSDSDMWSYGIVLWEIATLAEQPYQGLSNEEVLKFVTARGRLERPPECSDLLYDIMRQCWSWLPNDRPVFWDVVERLVSHVSQDFRVVSFIHNREGLEHRIINGRQRAYNPPALSAEDQEDMFGHYNVSEDEVSLHVGTIPRRPSYLQESMRESRKSGLSPSDHF